MNRDGGPNAARHRTVLLDEAVDALALHDDGFYVDGTFGRGGHSAAILARLGADGRLLALDRDPEAIAHGAAWQDGRFELVHARFSELPGLLEARGRDAIDGLLLDLGVSSPQIDDAARGFSFRGDGPLDMRMDPTRGLSARQWLLAASEQDIEHALRTYGEERFAGRIAKAIAAGRARAGDGAFRTTTELAAVVAGAVGRARGRPEPGKDPATRTFQALRILVNQELEELADILGLAVTLLRPGGRLAVISFHSLEDRMVKQFIARESGRASHADGGATAAEAGRSASAGASRRHLSTGLRSLLPAQDAPPARLRSIGRILPGQAEVAANPRARSAVLRVAERA